MKNKTTPLIGSDDIHPASPIPLSAREKVTLVRLLREQHGIVVLNVQCCNCLCSAHEKLDAMIGAILTGVDNLKRIGSIPVAWTNPVQK